MQWLTMEWLTIIAIVSGPFIALLLNGIREDRKRSYERKIDVFKVLMSTRATPLAEVHVQSLNRIFIEFTRPKEEKIREAWSVLLDHYNRGPIRPIMPQLGQPQEEYDKYFRELQIYNTAQTHWVQRTTDLRVTLLKEMSVTFKYNFNEVSIRNAIYYPELHGNLETERLFLLRTVNDVLSGQRHLGINVMNWPEQRSEPHTKSTS